MKVSYAKINNITCNECQRRIRDYRKGLLAKKNRHREHPVFFHQHLGGRCWYPHIRRQESGLVVASNKPCNLNQIEFREVAKCKITFFFVRNPGLMGNGRLPLVVQDFKYDEKPL
jgi:hypothetical protein